MFGGFKASLNFFGKRNKNLHSELSPDMTVSGAYRTSRDDSFGYNNSFDQSPKPTATASEQILQQIRPSKSTNDMSSVRNVPPHLRKSSFEVSRDPRGSQQEDPRNGSQNAKVTKQQEKEQKRLEKQRLAEQKTREKQAREEQAKQERLRLEKEKRDAQQKKDQKEKRPDKKKKAPQPQLATPVAAAAQTTQQYSTNTLESSISRSSGPPPYSDVPKFLPETNSIAQSQKDRSGNVLYKKPEDTGSWDMISQHRQQTIRPTALIGVGASKNKQMVMDLNYNYGPPATSQIQQDNSEA